MKGISCFVLAIQVFLVCHVVSVHTIPKSIESSILDFSVDIMKVVAQNEGAKILKNIFMSPTNIFRASLLVYTATSSYSRAQLETALHIEDISTKLIKKYLRNTNGTSGTLLEAVRLYVDETVGVKIPYQKIVSNSLKKVDMSGESSRVVDEVNNFVENITDGMISKVLQENWIPGGNSIFISAIYFKSNWRKLFEKNSTSKKYFKTNDGDKVYTDMLINTYFYKYDYTDKLQCQVLSMEYKDLPYTMLVFLPKYNGTQTVETLISQLTPSLIKDAYKSLAYREVRLSIPKFKIDTEINMKNIFSQLGVTDIFTPQADFSVMTEERVQLSDAIHGAKIQLDEDGTMAAAHTAMSGLGSAPDKTQPIYFRANRPFLYMIYDINNHIPVFMGVMVNPTQ